MTDIYDKIMGSEETITIRRENLEELIETIAYACENMEAGDDMEGYEGVNVIEIPNLLSPEGIHSALEQLVEMTKDRNWERVKMEENGVVVFLFKTGNNYYDEYSFFHTAIQIKETDEKIAKIVQNYINFENAGFVYFTDAASPLVPAAGVLSTFDEKYLDLTREFMAVLDWEHSFYERTDFFKSIYDKWGNSRESVRFQVGLHFSNGIDYDEVGFLDRVDIGGGLHEWIQEKQNRRFAVNEIIKFLKEGEESSDDCNVRFMGGVEWRAERKGGLYKELLEEIEKVFVPPSYVRKKRYKEAQRYFDKAYDLQNKGKLIEATDLLLKGLELVPEKLDAHIALGNNLLYLKKFREAHTIYRNAVNQFPDSSHAHTHLGIILTKLEEHKQAQQSFLKAIDLSPKSQYAYYHLGCSYVHVGNYRQALVNFSKAVDKGENVKRLSYLMGVSLLEVGQYDQSISWFVKEIDGDGSKKINAYFCIARALGFKGDDKKASAALDKALSEGWETTRKEIEDDAAFQEIKNSHYFLSVISKFFP